MTPFLSALITSVTVLAIVLAGDLGRRRVTAWRLIRPLLAVVVVVAIFVHSLPHEGNDLGLQGIGIVLGLLLGAISASFLRTGHDEQGAYTVGAAGYATFWIVVFAARTLFAYGSEHWFADALVRFCIDYHISGADPITNSLVFLSLAMVLARTAVIVGRTRSSRSSRLSSTTA
ncbi:hypothetical protein [Amycolatopsis taiwanensis]|uniref:Uncharacterized protein n=1 Tax=Amycolatopsis taiwanensis TaxID=342230 RepID=A0A9W6R7I8_9PSEU|nr:hypothetical protein [Amycolatopsis taiwanensis]GLY68982.1 hypothetical protein Atai01_56010 [Amycolatopsis taiwanensis]